MLAELGPEEQLTERQINARDLHSREFRKIDVVVFARIAEIDRNDAVEALLSTVIEGGAISAYRMEKYVTRREAAEEIIRRFLKPQPDAATDPVV